MACPAAQEALYRRRGSRAPRRVRRHDDGGFAEPESDGAAADRRRRRRAHVNDASQERAGAPPRALQPFAAAPPAVDARTGPRVHVSRRKSRPPGAVPRGQDAAAPRHGVRARGSRRPVHTRFCASHHRYTAVPGSPSSPMPIGRVPACRSTFQLRPDASVRDTNVRLLHGEALAYEAEVEEAYSSLATFTGKPPPLWTKRNGFAARSRGQTQSVILTIATTGYVSTAGLLLLCLIPVYRFPGLCRQLFHRFYDRQAILLFGLREYSRDARAALQALFVYITL